ncbi:MAG: YqeG family HAD IIIA-type phosphatase [Clostridiales bacterium]|jgi:HAD superfamily phosphatase (TIGR01668 family)|nr:YqeG family HAD IIIA-type phosphatase [Clostridiales bacterium]
MFEKFFPDHYYDSVFEIPYRQLKASNIKFIFFDVDNTLAEFNFRKPQERTVSLLKRLGKMGFTVCLLTNNGKRSLSRFNKNLNLPAYCQSLKPLAGKARKAMKALDATPESSVIIGDQVLTDIWCGKKLNIKTILVKPLSKKDIWTVHLKRGFEGLILKQYKKKIELGGDNG